MKDKILDYLNEELSPTERIDFENALAKDPILQQEFKFQQDKWIQLRTAYLKQVAQAKSKTWATGAQTLHRKQKVIRLSIVSFAMAACLAFVYFMPQTNEPSSHFEHPVAAAASNDAPLKSSALDSMLRVPIKSLIPQSVFVQRMEQSMEIVLDSDMKKLINLYYISNEFVANIGLDNINPSNNATIAIEWLLKAMYKFEANPQNKTGVANCLERIPNGYFKVEKNLYQNAFSESSIQLLIKEPNNLHYEKAILLSKKR